MLEHTPRPEAVIEQVEVGFDAVASGGLTFGSDGQLYAAGRQGYFRLTTAGVTSSVRSYDGDMHQYRAECLAERGGEVMPFDLERIMRTEYLIDRYQDTYFVIDSFEQLMRETAPDFTPIYARLKNGDFH